MLLTGIHSSLSDVCALSSSINNIRYQQKIVSLLEGPTVSCIEVRIGNICLAFQQLADGGAAVLR